MDLQLTASLSINQVANVEKGLHISIESLLPICWTLDCDIADVIEWKQEKDSADEAE